MSTNNSYTKDEQIYNLVEKQNAINKLIRKIKKSYACIYLIKKSKKYNVLFVSNTKHAIKNSYKQIKELQTNKPILVTYYDIDMF